MEWLMDPSIGLFSPSVWVSLVILLLLEVVLGIDNLIFIAILSNKLPPHQRSHARFAGLSLALLMRIGLLAMMSWLITLTDPVFIDPIFHHPFSLRDLILVFGGFFLIQKATRELHERIEGSTHLEGKSKNYAKFWPVVLQIVILDAVFSFDAVITATSIAKHLWVMILAVTISMSMMLFAARALTEFVNRHPTVVVLCLSFLLMIGLSLVVEGFGFEVPKGYIYAAIGFSVFIEIMNQWIHRRQEILQNQMSRRERTADMILRLLGTKLYDDHEHDEEEEHPEEHDPIELFGEEERNMVSGVLTLSDRTIRSIMTPRNEISWININDSKEQILESLDANPHNQFPICDGTLDDVKGVARAKDIATDLLEKGYIDLEHSVRPALFSHRSTSVIKMMDIFRESKVHMVIVTDDFGGIQGVITLLDVFEAIAGEFPDEDETLSVEKVSDTEWNIDAGCDLLIVEQTLGIRGLVDDDDDYSSLGGLLIDRLDELPHAGDYLDSKGYRFTVTDVDDKRILMVNVTPIPESDDEVEVVDD
ncbi:MAG: TerC family protein [Xanthomonadaceae bacterium]|nr:TerC family protein [Xanthomonadaceae bacterium]